MLESLGRQTIGVAADVGALTIQFWRSLVTLPRALPTVGNRRRWRTAVQQMLVSGASALPVVGIMSCCLGYVAALQAAAELRRFDATRYVVGFVAVAFTRELAALITAVAVSGPPRPWPW